MRFCFIGQLNSEINQRRGKSAMSALVTHIKTNFVDSQVSQKFYFVPHFLLNSNVNDLQLIEMFCDNNV